MQRDEKVQYIIEHDVVVFTMIPTASVDTELPPDLRISMVADSSHNSWSLQELLVDIQEHP